MIIPDMDDRELTVNHTTGEPILRFYSCKHSILLNRHKLYMLSSERFIKQYLMGLRCLVCEKEFKVMEELLHREYEKSMKNGGLR